MITGQDLKRARKLADLTLEEIATLGAVSAGHLSRVENGERAVTPATIYLYERATGAPVEASSVDLSTPTVGDVKRKDLIRLAGATLLGSFATDSESASQDDTATAGAQWLAWELWHKDLPGLPETDVPADLQPGIAVLVRQLQVLRSPDGALRFAHPALIDFHIATRVFGGIATGSPGLLTTAQTSHATDLVIREFVQQDERSSRSLQQWMRDGSSAVLRVNAAGILAKVPSATLADNVITALRVDQATRDLYLTAVTHRVLALPWAESQRFVADSQGAQASTLSEPYALRLAEELRNPRDAAARWCSAVLLHTTGTADREPIKAAVADALHTESARENLRTMAALLAGVNPITA